MSLIPPKPEGGSFEPLPAGMHIARCVQMLHIGTETVNFNGEEKQLNKVRLNWELPNELKAFKDGEAEKPLMIGRDFTFSLHEKAALRITLNSWRGKALTEDEVNSFDITKLLGVPCMLNVVHVEANGKTYANIANVTPVMKGAEVPDQVTPNLEFNFVDKFGEFNNLPEWIQKRIKETPEYLTAIGSNMDAAGKVLDQAETENLPF